MAYGAPVHGPLPDASAHPESSGVPPVPPGAGRAVPMVRRRARRDDAEQPVPGDAESLVEVRRSTRRRRTVTAYRESGRTVVLIPAAFSPAEERRWVEQMVAKLQTRE